MITIKNEYIVGCDIDDTLVMHTMGDILDRVLVDDPVREGCKIIVYKNNPMIRLIKEEAARGAHIIFWSAGGYQWASNVIDALGLRKQVKNAIIMTKPCSYCDDKDVKEWLSRRIYLTPDTSYKKEHV